MCKVLGHTGSIACNTNGWTNCFVPLFLCKLGSNHSVRQGMHKRCIEGIKTGGCVTLSVINLSGKFLTDMGDVIQCIRQGVGEVDV